MTHRLIVCFASLLGLAVCSAQDVTKSVKVVPKSGPLQGQIVYTDSYALFVGIGTYQNSRIPQIPPAPNDARTMRDLLVTKYGFNPDHVQILTDAQATGESIRRALAHLCDTSLIKPTDRVFVYFSGHGQGLTLQDGAGVGYLIPYDATIDLGDISNPVGYQNSCLDMEDIVKSLRASPAKHRTVVVDACFSGFAAGNKAVTGTTYTPDALQRMLDLSGLYVMTAGTSRDEAAAEGSATGLSLFTRALVDSLNEATINGGTITMDQLAADAAAKTMQRSDSKQQPLFGEKFGSGQMLLFSAAPPPVAKPGTVKVLPTQAVLSLSVTPVDAAVEVDGKSSPAQSTFETGADGKKTVVVSVHKDGFKAARYQVELTAGETTPLAVNLEPVAGSPPVAAGVPAAGVAALVKQADDAYAAANFGVAFPLYKQGAEGGDAHSMVQLATMLRVGDGTPRDATAANDWLLKGANAGNVDAMLQLAKYQGRDEKAIESWLIKAADSGRIDAKARLGAFYDHRDTPKAIKLLREAADKGSGLAMWTLGSIFDPAGQIYDHLSVVAKDPTQSKEWYQQATAANLRAAENGDAEAMVQVGLAYAIGRGVEKDLDQGNTWFRKAADKGNTTAMLEIGLHYSFGLDGQSADKAQAIEWYQKAIDRGDASAMAAMGRLYQFDRDGKNVDPAKALEWFQKADDTGMVDGLMDIGLMYQYGFGVPKDLAKALEVLEKSANRGSSFVMNMLGEDYERGTGVAEKHKDPEKAKEWYRKAVAAGVEDAKVALARLGG